MQQYLVINSWLNIQMKRSLLSREDWENISESLCLYRWQTTVNKWTDDDVIDKNPFVSIFGLINNVWCIFPSQRCSFRTQQTIFTRNIHTKEFTSDKILMLYVYSILPLKKIILLTIFFCLFFSYVQQLSNHCSHQRMCNRSS